MLIPILLKTVQIFGIIATISMLVAVIIKLLVISTGRLGKAKPLPKPAAARSTASAPEESSIHVFSWDDLRYAESVYEYE